MSRVGLLFFSIIFTHVATAQVRISGSVVDQSSKAKIPYAKLFFGKQILISDSSGNFSGDVTAQKYSVLVEAAGYESKTIEWNVEPGSSHKTIELEPRVYLLDSVSIVAVQRPWDVRSQLQTVGTTIYAGKKNELVDLNAISANTATNNARQLYAKVPGINI